MYNSLRKLRRVRIRNATKIVITVCEIWLTREALQTSLKCYLIHVFPFCERIITVLLLYKIVKRGNELQLFGWMMMKCTYSVHEIEE